MIVQSDMLKSLQFGQRLLAKLDRKHELSAVGHMVLDEYNVVIEKFKEDSVKYLKDIASHFTAGKRSPSLTFNRAIISRFGANPILRKPNIRKPRGSKITTSSAGFKTTMSAIQWAYNKNIEFIDRFRTNRETSQELIDSMIFLEELYEHIAARGFKLLAYSRNPNFYS